ncbi:hypothetical protein CFC21_077853, partial [Triticum aestivum]
SEMVKEFYK